MAQIYKIYMNQSLLILADYSPEIKDNVQSIGLQDIDLEKLFIESVNNREKIIYIYINNNIQKIFKDTLSKIRIIRAAGGLVKNGKGEYLFIYRLGKWDLPKGKVEEGEKIKVTARREVEEECGISIDYLGEKICTTYHTYSLSNKLILKQTNWYEMGINKSPELIPQLEEDITKAEWIKPNSLKKIRENTYPLILDIIQNIE